MKESELETMRKSFKTVKDRSSKIKNSSSIKRLEKRVREIEKESIANKEELMDIAVESFRRNGIDVEYAKTKDDALNIIYDLLDESDSKVIAKAKSNTLGEIELKSNLAAKGYDVVETDLGDRILQLKKEDNKPVHPTGPASHLNVDEIASIVNESMKANVVAAEEGSIVLVHNEGNISLVSLKDLHIIVAGIDKFVPVLEDAMSVAKLETVYATGNYVTSYINVISGPSKTADIEKKLLKNMYGAERVVVILLDNGRSEAREECLWCIGCGNCIVNCPVYNAVGNEFGITNYLGGRGVAMSKFIENDEKCFESGLYKCTLCGLCTINCPVSIPTNDIIEKMRKSSQLRPKAHEKISKSVIEKDSPY